ncbi:hypothetical protein BAS10_14575 [Elizabethkingia meningoseptica]|uniref:class I SAM-dependent methyltransferase n=1 Tax=Elizabethkingia meningoseptica TaxID=238 RepID=UPI00099B0C51|nr:class I SAM-dependent methyltransferase [Elizabethkingia meningoseptica]OPC04299.1 hypothetical protein BAS10_14575 [Elizabethkingia meningoseptica]
MKKIFRKIKHILNKGGSVIKKRGFINSCKYIYTRYIYFLKYRINLFQVMTPEQLKLENRFAYNYEPSNHYTFIRMLKSIDWNWEESVFIDIGCGKGAAILLATRYNFKRYIGVELSTLLAEECDKNIRKFTGKKAIDYTICNCDAMNYEIPDDVNVFYFYNPFAPPVLKAVMQRIEESLQRNPRKVIIFYFNAIYLSVLLDSRYKIIHEEEIDPILRYKFGNYVLTN